MSLLLGRPEFLPLLREPRYLRIVSSVFLDMQGLACRLHIGFRRLGEDGALRHTCMQWKLFRYFVFEFNPHHPNIKKATAKFLDIYWKAKFSADFVLQDFVP